MGRWEWYWKFEGDEAYGGEANSRVAVIADALKETRPGDRVEIIEARMSDAKIHEGSDFIPFLRLRNHEVLVVSDDGQTAEPV